MSLPDSCFSVSLSSKILEPHPGFSLPSPSFSETFPSLNVSLTHLLMYLAISDPLHLYSPASFFSFPPFCPPPLPSPLSLPPRLSLSSPSRPPPSSTPSATPSPACCLGHPAGLLPCCPGYRPHSGHLHSPPPSNPRHQQPPSTFLLFFLRANRNPVARWNAHLNQPIQEPNCLPCLIWGFEEGHSPHSSPAGEPLHCPLCPLGREPGTLVLALP